MGTPVFARAILEQLIASHHSVVAVVTGPDKKSGRGGALLPTPVAEVALRHHLTVLKPLTLKGTDLAQQLRELQADLFVVAAFRILPASLFSIPRLGAINVHTSLLPKYRGAAPIHWAIINGEKETGLTSFFLKERVDSGDMIAKQPIMIDANDTYDSLHDRMAAAAGPFAIRTIDLIAGNAVALLSQTESEVTQAPKLTDADCWLDFAKPVTTVRQRIMGLSSKPGASTSFRGRKLKIYRATVSDLPQSNESAGALRIVNGELLVRCQDGWLTLLSVVPEGKKEMDGRSFVNGFRPQNGELFGAPLAALTEKK